MRGGEEQKMTGTSIGKNTVWRPIRVLKVLGVFAWFCSKQNRENIKLISAALNNDAHQMRQEGRSRAFIQCVLLWHALAGTTLPIVWYGFRRLLAAILPIGKLITKIVIAWSLVSG